MIALEYRMSHVQLHVSTVHIHVHVQVASFGSLGLICTWNFSIGDTIESVVIKGGVLISGVVLYTSLCSWDHAYCPDSQGWFCALFPVCIQVVQSRVYVHAHACTCIYKCTCTCVATPLGIQVPVPVYESQSTHIIHDIFIHTCIAIEACYVLDLKILVLVNSNFMWHAIYSTCTCT